MKVIVAGFSKTGTKTMNAALTKLGYKVYDYLDNFMYLHDEWKRILEGNGSIEDFRKMYENVDAVVDTPAHLYWYEIHQNFPDAKIILTIRDEASWYKSWENHVKGHYRFFTSFFQTLSMKFIPIMRSFHQHNRRYANEMGMIWTNGWFFKGTITNEVYALNKYRRHNEFVKQKAPKDKLLMYNVKEGWEPLCEFLGKDIPETAFPRENVGGSHIAQHFQAHEFGKQKSKQTVLSFFVFLLVAIVIYYFLKQYPLWWGISTFLLGSVSLLLVA